MNEPSQDEHTTGVAPSAPLTSAINLFSDDGIPEDVKTKKNRSSCTPNSSERRRSSAKQSQSIASRASGLTKLVSQQRFCVRESNRKFLDSVSLPYCFHYKAKAILPLTTTSSL
jgi:hypothetical protein